MTAAVRRPAPARRPVARWALGLVAAAGLAACQRTGYDVVLLGGRIVDGTGNPWFYGDVAIRGDRIVRVTPAGMLQAVPARRRIDARDLVVAPGFIDIMDHSRQAALRGDGRMVSKITQGITTEIMGEGLSDGPVNDRTASRLGAGRGPHGFRGWLEAMQAHGVSVNVGSFVGATTVRTYAMGAAQRPPTPAELDTMRAVVRRAMVDGAFGVASALVYPPGSFASTDELIELARASAPYGGVYATHLRSEGNELLQAMDEALEIGQQAGVPVEIYHFKAAGAGNWDKIGSAIAKLDSARAAGQDVGADMYPYAAAQTALAACLPPWASADGRLLERLDDSSARARIHEEMLDDAAPDENLCRLATPAGAFVAGLTRGEDRRFDGLRLSEIAQREGKDWANVVIDLVWRERHGLRGVFFLASDEAVALELRQPWIKFGTDAVALDPDSARGVVHPRAYGTYPRVLGKYVREERVLQLEDAVRKMTSAAAARLSITDRGLLRVGMYADIVVFDPETVADDATYAMPHRAAIGVRYVLVNGTEVVRNGEPTGAKPGRIVHGPGWRP